MAVNKTLKESMALRPQLNKAAEDIDGASFPSDQKQDLKAKIERTSKFLKTNTNAIVLEGAVNTLVMAQTLLEEKKIAAEAKQQLMGTQIELRETEERERKANQLARVDALTEILNRRGFEESADHLFRLYTRKELNDLAVIFIDVKKFKNINDSLGHAIGDDALKRIADILDDTARDEDLVGRFAGDEFIIACPGKHPEILRERVYKAFDNATLFVSPNRVDKEKCVGKPPKSIPLSVDIGLASATDNTPSLDSLVVEADTDMYKEKNQERTRIELASDAVNPENAPG